MTTIQDTAIEKLRHLPDPLAQVVNNFIDRLINQPEKRPLPSLEQTNTPIIAELFPHSDVHDSWNQVMLQIASSSSNQQAKVENLFQQWSTDDDITEQQETLQWLTQALDDDRLSDRPLFP